MNQVEFELIAEGESTEGVTVSNGNFGRRINVDGLIWPATMEVSRLENRAILQYNGMIQAGYNLSTGELTAAWIYFQKYWEFLMATNPMTFGTGMMQKVIEDLGCSELVFSLDMDGYPRPLLLGLMDGELINLSVLLQMAGSGINADPLIGRLGKTGISVFVTWDNNFLRLGVGEGRALRVMPIAQKVAFSDFFQNINNWSTKMLFGQSMPLIAKTIGL